MTHGVNHFSGGPERASGYTPDEDKDFSPIVIRPATKEDIGFDPRRAKKISVTGRTLESASLHGAGT